MAKTKESSNLLVVFFAIFSNLFIITLLIIPLNIKKIKNIPTPINISKISTPRIPLSQTDKNNDLKLLLAKILPEVGVEVWAIDEGEKMDKDEVVIRIKAPYSSFGLYDTAICGTLSSSSSWSTAANECVEAANGIPVICTGSRYVHPLVSSILDYSSIIGGCLASSTILGSRLSGLTPSGDMPHSLPLLFGDTLKAVQAFDKHILLHL